MSLEYWKLRFENESLKEEIEEANENIKKLKRQLREKVDYILLLEHQQILNSSLSPSTQR